MRIMVREGETLLADLFFEEEEITIGSQPDCSIHLPDMRISPRNALIVLEGDEWRIENLDPVSKIMVNNHVLTERKILHNDDEVVLRDYMLRVYLDAEIDHRIVEEPQLTTEELAEITKYPLPPGAMVKQRTDDISLDQKKLERISQATVELAGSRDIHELVDVTLRLMLSIFQARVAWIGIRRKFRGELEVLAGRLRSGQNYGTNPLIDLLQYRCVERTQHICVRRVREYENVGTAMAVPLSVIGGTLGMIYVDRAPKTKRFQIPDLDFLSVISSHIAARLYAIVQQRIQRDAKVQSTEVDVVSTIQTYLDPKSSPDLDNLQLAAYSRSGQENPGDVYDVMQHPDTKITSFMLGHVNATGALLALSMARLHSTFRVGCLHNDPPHALARAFNWLMYDEKDPSTVETVFLFVDPPSGKIKYTRAGKIGAFIVNNQGLPRPLQGLDTPPIGQVRNYEYVSWMEQLAPGETLALYSRGAASSTNIEGERFGEKRFIEMVCDGFCQTPSTTIEDISSELSSFFEDGRHPDDISIVLLHRPLDYTAGNA
ncbi:MAG: SpoIIE family protein phosphatase [Planctomycetota bacterium]|nr:MAG: SpoIIE family protein phosphatase [Planctomycetota bacterium]